MSTYSAIGLELDASRSDKLPGGDCDGVRRKYARLISNHTGRPLIIYAVDFIDRHTEKNPVNVNIDLSDIPGFEEVMYGLDGPNLDVVIHSPGGSPEACESIVKTLRSRFSHIRFIVPGVAKSAATMLAMSGNEILMDSNAELGPIDPQLVRQNGRGVTVSPAQAVLDQFEQAQSQIQAAPASLPAWYPILQEMAPSLLAECRNAIQLSETLVRDWLNAYMFSGEPDGPQMATRIASWLGNHNNFRSHGRRIDIATLKQMGVKVTDLSGDSTLHTYVRSLYNAIVHTFHRTGCFRFYENHNGIGQYRIIQPPQPVHLSPSAVAAPAKQLPPQTPAAPLNRQQRRQMERGKR